MSSAIISKKRGITRGSTILNNKTNDDWYVACSLFRSKKCSQMTKAFFLRASLSGPVFSGNLSEQQTFGRKLKLFDVGMLKSGNLKRQRLRKFEDVARLLSSYLDLRERKYVVDKCGVSWVHLANRSRQFAYRLGYNDESFKASPGWLSNVIRNSGKVSKSVHGEANEMSREEREAVMHPWRIKFHGIIEDKNIPIECIYNGDQTGLYYQKLPNRVYISKDNKATVAGVKQMKDKTRITAMICTAADGSKVPLAIVGKPKKTMCFRISGDEPPIAYTNQKNAWFDRSVTVWWIKTVFWPHHLRKHGDVYCILLLDNCTAHDIDMTKLPYHLIVLFLPPNVTNTHQPADMGVIACLKVGYKTVMLEKLLSIFDVEGGFEQARVERAKQIRGCAGIEFGGKATLLDCMVILDSLWSEDGKYARESGIKRCWRKADILPKIWECDIENDVGRSSYQHEKKISKDDCRVLCCLMEQLQVRCQNTSVGIGDGFSNSFGDDPRIFSEKEFEKIAETWVGVEDDKEVQCAEIDEELGLLVSFDKNVDGGQVEDLTGGEVEDGEVDDLVVEEDAVEKEVEEAVPVLVDEDHVDDQHPKVSLSLAEQQIELLRSYNSRCNVGLELENLLERYAHGLRKHHASKARCNPTLHSFFKPT